MTGKIDRINLTEAGNLFELFCVRVRKTPDKLAYRYFDKQQSDWQALTWSQMADCVALWQAALRSESLNPGDRVALMVSNCPSWVMFELAAIGLGLVVVPLYTNDRSENVSYIVDDAQIKVLFIETSEQWNDLKDSLKERQNLSKIICMETVNTSSDPRLIQLNGWLPDPNQRYPLSELSTHKSTLATIVYTSGTTGRPKGVMLSHENILWNAYNALDSVAVFDDDEFLSFLPLSHMFERTVGHYLPIMSGAIINYARSIEQLAEDLLQIKPTVLITVPRIFERVYNKIQTQLGEKSAIARFLFNSAVNVGWHSFLVKQRQKSWHPKLLFLPVLKFLVSRKILAKLGGRMRVAISGGAPLSIEVARTFIGLGLTISQGYGLTESSPIISTNKLDNNDPGSVGEPITGMEVKLGENDELLVRSPSVMLGYWQQDDVTRQVIDADGWLHTGDKAKIENKHIYITGRIKEILVLSNGEKVPPADVEMAITKDPLFDQLLVIGEQKPYLSAIAVLNQDEWKRLAAKLKLSESADDINSKKASSAILKRMNEQIKDFPGYANIYQVFNTFEPWTVENGLITPTLKLKRNVILDKYADAIEQLYKGH